jgi:hypothetical protein
MAATMKSAIRLLTTNHNELGSWKAVSEEIYNGKIPPGTLSSIAKGREPKNELHRELLGLPAACIACGKKKKKLTFNKWRDLPTALLKKAIENRG